VLRLGRGFLSVFLSAPTFRFHTLSCDRHQVLQDYVFPFKRVIWTCSLESSYWFL